MDGRLIQKTFPEHEVRFIAINDNYDSLTADFNEESLVLPVKNFIYDGIFGRSAAMDLLGLKSSGTSKLLSNLVQAGIIEPVSGHGKGKYRFVDKR